MLYILLLSAGTIGASIKHYPPPSVCRVRAVADSFSRLNVTGN